MIRFDVKSFKHGWRTADRAILLHDGRLAYWIGSEYGVTVPPLFRLSEATIRHPRFKEACWRSLDMMTQATALARIGSCD